ncbi:MAG: bifunctional riboflavin kinase/FAD synthetase [Flavobacteriaceae bacterium]|nr:bifunctional riboflavin kinase/FAD synthetase [Flavobacteriaceae bacterium]
MKVFHSISAYKNNQPSVVTIGTFDGVHLGHKAIISQLLFASKKENLTSIILTFFPHPRIVLQEENSIKLINTISERENLLQQTKLENLIIHPFTKEFSRLTALEFVRDILVNQLHIKKLIIGYDHRFGRNRDANIEDLIEFGKTFNFEVEEIKVQQFGGVSISSTKIRKLISEGDIKTTNTYLGHPFTLSGKIVSGRGIGKTLSFPTANLQVEEDYKIIPKKGVYLTQSKISGKNIFGLTNIGTNPTVNGKHQTIETYFLDYNENLYNKTIQLKFITRIRDEKVFNNVEALKAAIKEDEVFARNYIQDL